MKIVSTLLSSILIICLTGCVGFRSTPGNGSSSRITDAPSQQEQTQTPEPVIPWYPDDFQEMTPTVAFKPFEIEAMDCDYSSAHFCYQIYIVTNEDCTVFVSLNFLNDGVVVDDSIDSATVQAGELAILSFVSFEAAKYSGEKNLRFTDVNCY